MSAGFTLPSELRKELGLQNQVSQWETIHQGLAAPEGSNLIGIQVKTGVLKRYRHVKVKAIGPHASFWPAGLEFDMLAWGLYKGQEDSMLRAF